MKTKVLFMIHDLSVGGAEKVLVNLVNNMDHKRFDVTVLSLFGGGVNEEFLSDKVRYKYIFKKTFRGNSKILLLFSPEKLHRMLVKENYDIEISYLEGPCARIISGCENKNTKLYSWVHVEQHSREVAAMSFRSYKESVKCYECFDKIVCVSEYVKNDFMSLYPTIKDVVVKFNTNETNHILNLQKEKIEGINISKSKINLIGVGKIVPVKGFDRLARIHKRLLDDNYPVHTYILGIGPEQKKIENYLESQGIRDTFTFLGYQKNPYKYVGTCDVFVCASSAEGFSTAATEALIVGTPVVTTRVSGMEEMLGRNNEYGIVTENNEDALYEGIKRLLDDQKLLNEYTAKAIERGKTFSTDYTVNSVQEMLLSQI